MSGTCRWLGKPEIFTTRTLPTPVVNTHTQTWKPVCVRPPSCREQGTSCRVQTWVWLCALERNPQNRHWDESSCANDLLKNVPRKKSVREYPCRTHLGASGPPGQSETPPSADMKHIGDSNKQWWMLIKPCQNVLKLFGYVILFNPHIDPAKLVSLSLV